MRSATFSRSADAALLELLSRLGEAGYDFISPTPATHRLVRRRRSAAPGDFLRDVFGWGRRFEARHAPAWLLHLLREAEALDEGPEGCASTIRISKLDGRLHLHSASSHEKESVFLGPDSYRYVRFLRQSLGLSSFQRALEIGVGAGAGALMLAAREPGARVTATDVNPEALRLACLNARHSGLELDLQAGSFPAGDGRFDLIVANPPYIAGRQGRLYCDGGDQYGAETALEWTSSALQRLEPEGRLVLYTGAPVVAGADLIRRRLEILAVRHGGTLNYDEIDPDVFGGLLKSDAYRSVERIAAVGAVITMP